MALAPTNIRSTIDNIDGTYVKVTWDDPNPSGTTDVRWLKLPNTSSSPITRSAITREAFLSPGDWAAQLQVSGNWSANSAPFTPAPQPPPPPATERQKLEDVLGTLAVGSKIAVYPGTPVIQTVNADGSVS